MQYSIDTLSIEIGRLHKAIRKLKTRKTDLDHEQFLQERITEFENQIRELRKAIGVLKEYIKSNNQQYQSRYTENPSRYKDTP